MYLRMSAVKVKVVGENGHQVHSSAGGGGGRFVLIEMLERVNDNFRKRLRQCVLKERSNLLLLCRM